MERAMPATLEFITGRRAIRSFNPVSIAPVIREQILQAACAAPSSFNIQPYRYIWVESPDAKKRAAELCMGQSAAKTASVLVVAVADVGSWKSTAQGHLQWMRESGMSESKIKEAEKRLKLAKYFFVQGWFNVFGAIKWVILRGIHPWKIAGIAPVSKQGLFKWAAKNAALSCENLMIAAEALGFNTCPMEGFDDLRLSRFLGLSSRHHEIVMVIAIGKKPEKHVDQPQWRRPLESTVTML
jgi:nitroreductase